MKSNNNAAITPPGKPSAHVLTGTGPLDYDLFNEFLYTNDWNDCVEETKETDTIAQDDSGSTDVDAVDNGLGTLDQEKSGELLNLVNHDEPVEDKIKIPEDSFSMFYAAKNWKEGLPPLMVFTLQLFTLSLILYNLLETNGSPLDLQYNIPVDVQLEVTMSQVIACIISVYTAADFVDALFFVRRPIILPNCQDERREIKDLSLKWEFSNLMRMSEGAFAIAVSFVFIVQSTTVIDLFLNFAGVAFVSELDDAHFKLAERGLLGKRAKKLADRLSTFKVHTDEKKVRGIIRNCLFVTIITGMLCGLAVIAYRQDHPKYACKSVTLTVGERKYPSYRSFSGTYTLDSPVKIAKRAVYIQDQGEGAYIAYCKLSERWTVTPHPLLLVDDDVPSFNDGSFPRDPCSTHVMVSTFMHYTFLHTQ